jgi:BRO1-like domain
MTDQAREEAVQPIHPSCFGPEIKVSKGTFLDGLSPYITSDSKKSANMLIATLDDSNKAFTNCLTSTAVSEEGFNTALQDYISALLVMVNASSLNKGAAAGATNSSSLPASSSPDHVDNALTEVGAGADVTPPVSTASGLSTPLGSLTGDSPLRYAVKFSWNQVLLPNTNNKDNVEIADAVYELASALTAAAIWCQRRAALFHCESTPLGVPSGPSGQAYKLLRQAAGLYDYVSNKILPLLSRTITSTTEASDCTAPVLQAAALCAVGDAQSITVLRAISKGNSSSLIASLARDTGDIYKEGAGALISSTKDVSNTKLLTYLQYKQAVFEAYAQIFKGITQWKAGQAGTGLCCLKEAETIYFRIKKLAAAFDKAPPSSLGARVHGRFDDELDKVLYDTLRRIEKENSAVYYQRVPNAVPPLPEGKRLAAATVFELPSISKAAKETDTSAAFSGLPTSADENTGKKAGKNKNKNSSGGGGCCRWLFCCCAAKAVVEAVDEEVKKNDDGKAKKEEESVKITDSSDAATAAGKK